MISACDIGLVCTVAGVDSSSFPSKTIDYLRAGLPIVAAVEQESDYREFLRRWNIGISIPAGDATALFAAVIRVVDDQEITANIARNARACLRRGVRRGAGREAPPGCDRARRTTGCARCLISIPPTIADRRIRDAAIEQGYKARFTVSAPSRPRPGS